MTGHSRVESFLDSLRGLGWRGLLVAHSRDPRRLTGELARLLSSRGSCAAVATRGFRGAVEGEECIVYGPLDLDDILGSEFDYALIAVEGLLRPNVVAAVGETVKAGGVLAIAAPPLPEWSPGPAGGTGLYKAYLASRIPLARSLLWLDWDAGRVYVQRLPEKPAPTPKEPERFKSRHGVPRRLLLQARTLGQAWGLDVFADFLKGEARSLLVTGNRGRGKSFLIGLGVALAIRWHAAGRVEVVAPSIRGAASLMRGLLTGLDALGVKARVRREREGVPTRVTGPWFRVALSTPEEAEPAPMLVVDEAAAVGVARVRRLSWKSGRVVVSTTLHGYEGSGRAVERLLLDQLPRPLERLTLEEPIRYRPGDPLEEWLYDTFILRPDPSPPPSRASEARCTRLERRRLAARGGLLASVAGLLALAHYRSEPDEILVLLESPHHEVYALQAPDGLVAVADVAWEDWGMEEAARLGLAALERHAGPLARGLRAARIVRIAVHPQLQRRGYGSRLLSCAEDGARGAGVDAVVTMFSRHEVIGFWVANGYMPVYMSPRYNKATGEKNVAFAKPLSEAGARAVEEASSAFRLRLLLSGHSIYRDVAAEKLPLLIDSSAPAEAPLGLTGEQERRLRLYLEEAMDYEQASDAVFLAVVSCLSRHPLGALGLTGKAAVALVARVVQGKPLDDVAYILGTSVEDANRVANEAARALLSAPQCRPPS